MFFVMAARDDTAPTIMRVRLTLPGVPHPFAHATRDSQARFTTRLTVRYQRCMPARVTRTGTDAADEP